MSIHKMGNIHAPGSVTNATLKHNDSNKPQETTMPEATPFQVMIVDDLHLCDAVFVSYWSLILALKWRRSGRRRERDRSGE